jgi:competence protein ComEA
MFKEDRMKTTAIVFLATLFCVCSVRAAETRAQKTESPKPTAAAPVTPSAQIINLNTATAEQIATLPGIGPKTANLIVEYRKKNGNFKKIEEIMNVRGIGEKSFLKLKSLITVGTAS